MQTTTDAHESPGHPRQLASLTRVLEILAEVVGLNLELRVAAAAASDGMALPDANWSAQLAFAARRAGLRIGPCDAQWPGEYDALGKLEVPAVTWLPVSGGGCWLILLERHARGFEVAMVDSSGSERRRRMRAEELLRWLNEAFAGEERGPEWTSVEALLPLASMESRAKPDKCKDGKLGPVRRLLALADIERQDLGVVIVYAVAIGAMTLAVPVAVQALVNTVAFGSMLQPLIVLTLLLLMGLAFVAVLSVLQTMVAEAIQRRIFVRVAADFARRLPRMSPKIRGKVHTPELVNRFFDTVTLQKAATTLLLDGLALILQIAVGMLLLAFYHPLLLAFDLALLIAIAIVVFVFGRGTVSTAVYESKRKYAVAAWLEGLAASPTRFADASSRAFADMKAETLIREWLQARSAHFTRLLRQITGGLSLQVLASVALLGIGGWLVVRRQLTLGQLVAAELVVSAIGAGLGKIGKQLESFYDASASADKIGQILDQPLEGLGGRLLLGDGPFSVGVYDVSRGEDLIEIEAGEHLGLRGRSPKHAAVIDHLFGLEGRSFGDAALPSKFEALLDGSPLSELDIEALRGEVALVRNIDLIAASVLDNLSGQVLVGDTREVKEVLELCGLIERVTAMPEGVHSMIQPDGAPLCEVDARRLVLAHALLRRPRLLLIDGGLDGLSFSPEQRQLLFDHIFSPTAPWTVVVASDDPDVLAHCRQRVTLP